MAYNIGTNPGDFQAQDLYGSFKKGRETARRQPIIEQLEQLQLRKAERSAKSEGQKITLNDFKLKQAERDQQSNDMADIGVAASWALNQPNKEAAWEQVLDQYESEGKPIEKFRGRYDLMPMMSQLNDPDGNKQRAIQQNIHTMIQTMPQASQPGAQALASASPKAFYDAYGESLNRPDTTGQLQSLVATLPEKQKDQVSAVYAADPDAAVKLTTDLIKQQSKPKKDKTAAQTKAEGFYDRMVETEKDVQTLLEEGYDPDWIDRGAVGGVFTNWLASDEGQQYWNSAAEWARAKLRAESGAVIGIEEAREEARTYFPVAGDSEKVLANKKKLRGTAIKSMGKMAAVDEPAGDFPKITTQDKYNSLKPGSVYIGADGGKYRKPE